jgi:hypothetical protein
MKADMTTELIGNDSTPPELLMYWIQERHRILTKKQSNESKPWSEDPVFQNTYFCNVRREDDKVTKWIRNFYSPYAGHPLFEFNILLSRFLNRIETLAGVGYMDVYDPHGLERYLEGVADAGFTIWGGAYVITTHGIKMPKLHYLTRRVLPSAYGRLERLAPALQGESCRAAAEVFERIEGVGSFLSAQIVADLKNTKGHPLNEAKDWWTFVQPGPGSLRGASWFHYGQTGKVTPATFQTEFKGIRYYVDAKWPAEIPRICNQDLQNCLCEFDKYMRVKNGTGRSKRRYNGV